jgi:DNA-binding GntR family transcriptional regulator
VTRTIPLYKTIAEDLRADIANGRYAPGDLLPTELAMVKARQVSRHTARQALDVLHQEGLIARKRGVGTIVVTAEASAGFVQTIDSLAALMQYAREARLQITAMGPATRADVALLPDGAPRDWVCIKGLRAPAPQALPIAITQIFVRKALCPPRAEIGAHDGAIHELIEARFGVKVLQVEQELAAVPLSDTQAAQLGETDQTPGLQILRRYIGADEQPFQISVSVHPGSRFTYRMQVCRA